MTAPVQAKGIGAWSGRAARSHGRNLVTMRVSSMTEWTFDEMDALTGQVIAVLDRFGFDGDQIETSANWDTEWRSCTGELVLLDVHAYVPVSRVVVRAVIRALLETDQSLRIRVGTLEPFRAALKRPHSRFAAAFRTARPAQHRKPLRA